MYFSVRIITAAFLLAIFATVFCEDKPKGAFHFNITVNRKVCLKVDITGIIHLNKTHQVKFNSSQNATGSCASGTSAIILSNITMPMEKNSSLTFIFNMMKDQVNLSAIHFRMGNTSMNKTVNMTLSKPDRFFECHSTQVFHLTKKAKLVINYVKMQAFNVKGNYSAQGDKCNGDKTTTVRPITTPKPKPPTPEENKFKVMDKEGNTCVLLQMRTNFTIAYHVKKTKKSVNFRINEKNHLGTNGSCGNVNSSMIILFRPSSTATSVWKLIFNLTKGTAKAKTFEVSRVNLIYWTEKVIFPNITDKIGQHSVAYNKMLTSKTSVKESYVCNHTQTLKMNKNVTMIVSHFRVKAFYKSKNESFFGKSHDCVTDVIIHNTVPIIIGVVLAVLVLVVIIIYLVGRRHRRQTGYQSI